MVESEQETVDFDLNNVKHRKFYSLGILNALRKCSYEEFNSSKLDTIKPNTDAGKVLSSLEEEGYLTQLDKGGLTDFYKKTNFGEENFQQVVNTVKESYRQKILDSLDDLDAEEVYTNLLNSSPGFETSETNTGILELPEYVNNDYSKDTLNFLDETEIIKGKSIDTVTQEESWDREICADQEDIDFVLQVLEKNINTERN